MHSCLVPGLRVKIFDISWRLHILVFKKETGYDFSLTEFKACCDLMICPENCSVFGKNAYSFPIGSSILPMSSGTIWFIMLFKSSHFLLIFCLDDLSMVTSWVLNTPTIILLLLYYLFLSLVVLFFLYT